MKRLVKVKNGTLLGMVGKDPRIKVFRGVPYAKPPVGDLRFRAPREMDDWEGVRTCYEYGPMAMMRQHPGYCHPGVEPNVEAFGPGRDNFYTRELHPTAADYEMSEDCLYLNIYTPAEKEEDGLPVFCYIHGGGLTDGYSYEVEFDPERLARQMTSYWANFVKYGDPNGMDYNGNPLPRWDSYQKNRKAVMWFRDFPEEEILESNPILEFRLKHGISRYKEQNKDKEKE